MKKPANLPKDTNQAAKRVVDLATMDESEMKAAQKHAGSKKAPRQTPGKRG